MTLVVSRAAIEAEIGRRREIREHSFGRWIAMRFVLSLVVFVGVALAVRALMDAPAWRDMSGWTLTVLLGVPAFMACVVTIVAEQLTFSDGALNVDRATARLSREIDQLTGPRWPLRLMRSALVLAVCAGVVLGVVVSRTGRPALLARGSDQAIVVAVAALLLASLAVAFAIRAASLFLYRGVTVQATPTETSPATTSVSVSAPASPGSEISRPHPSGSGSGSA